MTAGQRKIFIDCHGQLAEQLVGRDEFRAARQQPAKLEGEIRVWDPPSVFEWTWHTDVLRWELAPEGDGTRLTLTTWLGVMGPGTAKVAAGYHACLANLEELLDTGKTETPLIEVDVAPLERRYEEQVAAAGSRSS